MASLDYGVDPQSPIPVYYQVYQSLLDRIQGDEFAVDDALPPERQLAKDYSVSRITIIKALGLLERDDLIRREQGRGTFVNALASVPNGKIASMVFVTGVTLHPYIYSVLMGAARVASEAHHDLHLVGLYPESRDLVIERVLGQGATGVLIYPRPGDQDLGLCDELCREGAALVMVDRYYPQIACDSVIFEEEEAAYRMTQQLIAHGHRRIAVLTHHEVFVSSIANRITGYRRAMQEHSLDDEELVWLDVYSRLKTSQGQVGNSEMTDRLRERLDDVRPTALLALNHDVAERLHYDLNHISIEQADRILAGGSPSAPVRPDVAAFAYRDLVQLSPYNVLTALQPGELLGERAASLMIGRADGSIGGEPVSVRVPLEIV